MIDRSQRKWIIAWALLWGAFGLVVAILIYANRPQFGEIPPEEVTNWLLTPVVIVVAAVVIGEIFGFELYDWRMKKRTRSRE